MLTPTGVTAAQYWEAIKNDNPTHVRITFTNQGIILEDQDIDSSYGIEINDIINGETDLTFGKAVMKQFTAGFINSSRLRGIQWTGEFKYEMGVEISGTTNWVTIGYFRGQKPNNVTTVSIIEFTAYDRMQLFDRPVIDYVNNIAYPKKIKDIYHGLCDYVGISYVDGDELTNTFNRDCYTADTLPKVDMTNYSCRQLLGMLAEAFGCYAKIDANGKCKMVWFSDHTEDYSLTADEEFYSESYDITDELTWDEFDRYIWDVADTMEWNYVAGSDELYAIDYLMVKQVYGFTNYYPANMGGNVYQINENPYLNTDGEVEWWPFIQQQVDLYIKPIYDRLYEFGGHIPMRVECIGNWLIESGDVITVQIGERFIPSPIYARSLKWNGSCIDEYETTGNADRKYEAEINKNLTRKDVANEITLYLETESTTKDLNDLKDMGTYSINPSVNPNSPSDLTSYNGNVILTVEVFSTSAMQTIQTGSTLYTRRYEGAWGSWYKFNGTEV